MTEAKINSYLKGAEYTIYDTDAFRNIIEEHIPYLSQSNRSSIRNISAELREKYKGDWIGLMNYYNVPSHLHWVILRLNNLANYSDFNDSIENVIIPNEDDVKKIEHIYVMTCQLK